MYGSDGRTKCGPERTPRAAYAVSAVYTVTALPQGVQSCVHGAMLSGVISVNSPQCLHLSEWSLVQRRLDGYYKVFC